MAVKETLTLPYEIVADNHSFNKTKEAENLKEKLEQYGVQWTVDSNPQRKSILERAFRTLGDEHFKNRYGYIGQGVKTKVKNGLTSPELIGKYTKTENMLTYEQIVPIVCSVIEEYNKHKIISLDDTPKNRYERGEKQNVFHINMFKYMSLFFPKTAHKIQRGQITI